MLGQPRASQRYQAIPASDEQALTVAIVRLASQYGRYGSRRITVLPRTEGWSVNPKRVEWIWREGFEVAQKHSNWGRLWLNGGFCILRRPRRRHHV
ncbi:MAG TPA: IS3 family transposase [Gammaproteobacteria bacterium]|nr:IS3 family transposase [Gammaproteobacteria bacterium]